MNEKLEEKKIEVKVLEILILEQAEFLDSTVKIKNKKKAQEIMHNLLDSINKYHEISENGRYFPEHVSKIIKEYMRFFCDKADRDFLEKGRMYKILNQRGKVKNAGSC